METVGALTDLVTVGKIRSSGTWKTLQQQRQQMHGGGGMEADP